MLACRVLRKICIISSSCNHLKRFTGNSKWQKIRHTKAANEVIKSSNIVRSLRVIKKTVIAAGWVTDPEHNPNLEKALQEARKTSIPKETIDNFLKKLETSKERPIEYRLKGPNDCLIIVTYSCAVTNESELRGQVKKIIQRSKVLETIKTVNHVFEKKGIIVAKHPSKDATMDDAEEAAILGGADEVRPEDGEQLYRFLTESNALWPMTKYLRENAWDIQEAGLEDLPTFLVEVPEENIQELSEDISKLQDFPEFYKMVDNIA